MKSVLKIIIAFLCGIFVTGTTVYAITLLNGKDILFDNSNSSIQSTNVQDAIEELYEFYEQGDADASQIMEGKQAIVNGKLVIGTGKLDTRDRVYEFRVSQSTNVYSRNSTDIMTYLTMSWGSTATIYNEDDEVLLTVNVGESKTYQLETGNGRKIVNGSNSGRITVPLGSKQTIKISLTSAYNITSACTYQSGGYSGSVSVYDVTNADDVFITEVKVPGLTGDKEIPKYTTQTATGTFTTD